MIPSPQSQLSSFRDYYRHTSQNDSQFSPERTINLGIINFEVNKLFKRYEWKITQSFYWNMFYAFSKIKQHSFGFDQRIVAKINLTFLLKKINKKESKVKVKRKALVDFLDNINEMKSKQILFCQYFGLRYAGKIMIQTQKAFFNLTNKPMKRGQNYSKEQVFYLLKLSHAQLSIIVRNILSVIFQKNFQKLKHANMKHSSQPNFVSFFRPKKERRVYEHKIDQKIKKLSNFLQFYTLLSKKINAIQNRFMLKLKKSFKSKQKPIQKQKEQGDSIEIMNEAVRHMVYLTNSITSKSKKRTAITIQRLRSLKFQSLLNKLKIKQRSILNEYTLRWRDEVNRINNSISKQIKMLQRIKQQYVQQS